MVERNITLTLSEGLAHEADAQGLLEPAVLTSLVEDEVRRRRGEAFLRAADRLAGLGLPPLSQDEVADEIRAARAARRGRSE